jgi:hypothetical protein
MLKGREFEKAPVLFYIIGIYIVLVAFRQAANTTHISHTVGLPVHIGIV